MNERELRALVRSAVARHLGSQPDEFRGEIPVSDAAGIRLRAQPQAPVPLPLLSSHTLYTGLVNVGDACVIEPAAKCDHCGYCKSHGY